MLEKSKQVCLDLSSISVYDDHNLLRDVCKCRSIYLHVTTIQFQAWSLNVITLEK